MLIDTHALIGPLFDSRYFMYYEDLDAFWRAQLLGQPALFAPRSLVRHVHGAIRSDCDARWPLELPIAAAASAEAQQQRAIGAEHFDAVVAKIGHVHVAAANGHSEWCAQIAGACPCGAPRAQHAAVGRETLQAIVELIDHIQGVAVVERHAKG